MTESDPTGAQRFAVGLTGGIGCGKTLVANMFEALGATVIDTDRLARQLTDTGGAAVPAIRARFGDPFFSAAGAMDREKMRAHVFANPSARIALESILHPLIRCEAEQAASRAVGNYVIFVVPLLIESGQWQQRVSRILVVDCPEALQMSRVMARNGFSEQEVKAIMAAQASRAERLAAADDVIENDQTLQSLEPQITRLHGVYCAMAGC